MLSLGSETHLYSLNIAKTTTESHLKMIKRTLCATPTLSQNSQKKVHAKVLHYEMFLDNQFSELFCFRIYGLIRKMYSKQMCNELVIQSLYLKRSSNIKCEGTAKLWSQI